MIPVKIITKKQAVKLGLTEEKKQPSGQGFAGGGAVVYGNSDGTEEAVETFIIDKDDKKILTFMSEKRIKQLKEKKQFSKYIKQFNKIPKEVK